MWTEGSGGEAAQLFQTCVCVCVCAQAWKKIDPDAESHHTWGKKRDNQIMIKTKQMVT